MHSTYEEFQTVLERTLFAGLDQFYNHHPQSIFITSSVHVRCKFPLRVIHIQLCQLLCIHHIKTFGVVFHFYSELWNLSYIPPWKIDIAKFHLH